MKLILNLCTGILGLYLIAVAGNIIGHAAKSIYALCRGHKRESTEFSSIFLIHLPENPKNMKYFVIFITILIIGTLNEIGYYVLASNKIGAFYERSEYTENYEGFVYLEKDTRLIPIVATVHHSISSSEFPDGNDTQTVYTSEYNIHHVWLPYGIEQDVEGAYNGDIGKGNVNLGEWTCGIQLTEIATEESFKHLDSIALSANGDIVASRNSDIYHLEDCKYTQNIARNNFIRFDSPMEAEIFGFSPCEKCKELL